MTSVQALRDFINERLAAAAGEIFTVFQQTIVQYEEEIRHQLRLLENIGKPQIKFLGTENPQQHVGHQKTSSSLQQEEHEAPHIKEEEDIVEVTVTDGETDNSHDSVRDLTTQRLTAAAVEIFTLFEPTIFQYQEEIARQKKLLEITWQPQITLHRTELHQHRDCREEQIFKQETIYCLEQEEPEPPQVKEEPQEPEPPQVKEEPQEPEPPQVKEEPQEPEPPQVKEEPQEPEPPQVKEEPQEPEPPHIAEHEELDTSQGGEQLVLKWMGSIGGQSYRSEPEKVPDTEQLLSYDSEVHNVKKHMDSESTMNVVSDIVSVENVPVSEKQAEGEKLLCEETSGEIVCKKPTLCQNLKTLTDKKKNICEICGKIFKQKSKLLVHIRTHTGEKPYSCETCGKSFIESSKLLVHMRTHTGEKLYSCETCGKSFIESTTLLVHMETHTGEKPYSCETCGKGFRRKTEFLIHMTIHTGKKLYACETCGKNFIKPSKLLIHMRTHTGEKPFSCETCGRSFSVRSSLLSHVRTHTGEKPYSCQICGRSFIKHNKVVVHMRTHTGEKPYSCQTCGKSFSVKYSLLSHMRTHR